MELGRKTLGRRVLIFAVAAAALAVLIGAVTGDRGYLEVHRRRAAYATLQQEVERLNAENTAMMAEIAALKTDPYVLEKLAREQLGYAKPGEVVYLLPREGAASP